MMKLLLRVSLLYWIIFFVTTSFSSASIDTSKFDLFEQRSFYLKLFIEVDAEISLSGKDFKKNQFLQYLDQGIYVENNERKTDKKKSDKYEQAKKFIIGELYSHFVEAMNDLESRRVSIEGQCIAEALHKLHDKLKNNDPSRKLTIHFKLDKEHLKKRTFNGKKLKSYTKTIRYKKDGRTIKEQVGTLDPEGK